MSEKRLSYFLGFGTSRSALPPTLATTRLPVLLSEPQETRAKGQWIQTWIGQAQEWWQSFSISCSAQRWAEGNSHVNIPHRGLPPCRLPQRAAKLNDQLTGSQQGLLGQTTRKQGINMPLKKHPLPELAVVFDFCGARLEGSSLGCVPGLTGQRLHRLFAKREV